MCDITLCLLLRIIWGLTLHYGQTFCLDVGFMVCYYGGYQCSVLTKIDVNECQSSWKKNKSWQTDLLDSLVSDIITVSPWLPTAHNNTRAWGRQGTRRERGGERLLMSVKRRNRGSGAEAACVCVWRKRSESRIHASVADLRPSSAGI